MISPLIFYRFISFRRQYVGINVLNFILQKRCIKWVKVCPIHTSLLNYKKEPKKMGKKKVYDKPKVQVWSNMTVQELITALDCDIDVIEIILKQYKSKNEILSDKEIGKIGSELRKKLTFIKSPHLEVVQKKEKLDFVRQPPPDPKNLVDRPPIVTIMGHVDHGKTTLLDALRNSFIANQEFGGITQHIGAFSVEVKPGKKITFIDTPGHAAFTTMRARGAQVTDIVVLVVAADDGVMEQTVESIKIALRAQVKIIVAVNKIDKTNDQRVEDIKDQLIVEGIQVEDRGGNVQLIPISAKKKLNLDLLVDMILVEAEMMNLKGDPKGLVEGVVIESNVDKKGTLATVIVKRGSLRKRTVLLAEKCFGRIRLMLDENGKEIEEALPSTAVQVFGWEGLPAAGENVFEVDSEKTATRLIKLKLQKEMAKKQLQDQPFIMAKQMKHRKEYLEFREKRSLIKSGREYINFLKENKLQTMGIKEMEYGNNFPTLNIILKGDVNGTLEVLLNLINSYDKNDECLLKVVSSSVGNVNLSDLSIAEATNAIIYGFNVGANSTVEESLKKRNISFRQHNIIYRMIDDIKDELSARLPLKNVESIIGEAEVKENFFINVKRKKIPCAGSICTKGELRKNCLFKIIRGDEVIHDAGKLSSMRHQKNDVQTITKNVACGLMFETFSNEFKPADKIICYEIIEKQQKSSWDVGFNTSEK